MSERIRSDTESAVACSCVSSTVIKPIGLSSRTISPVSVIQAVLVRPENVICTLNAGMPRRPRAATTSRSSISIITGAFCIDAGSNTVHCRVAPATSPSAASLRPTLSISAGASFNSRTSVRLPDGDSISSDRRKPSRRPLITIGPVPGSSEKLNVWS